MSAGIRNPTTIELFEENVRLKEKLAKCKADKDYVWNLWRQLQSSSPDMTNIVDLIVTREKEKLLQKETHLKSATNLKEQEMLKLRKSLEDCQAELEVKSDKLRSVQSVLQERDEELKKVSECQTELDKARADLVRCEQERDEALGRYQQTAMRLNEVQPLMMEMEQKLSVMDQQNSQNAVKCRNLNNDLQSKSSQLARTMENLKRKNKEIKKLRLGVASSSETSEKIVILEKELAEKCSAMQQMDRQYRDKIEEFEAYVKQLQDGMGSLQMSGAENVPQLKEMLEKTEMELFELKKLIQAKDNELEEVRLSHERRLGRMKTVQAEHKLVLEQLKTYEMTAHNGGPTYHSLVQEDSGTVWNELHTYKKKYKDLEQINVELAEECDQLKTENARNKTLLSELQLRETCSHQDLFEKFEAIADVEFKASLEKSSVRLANPSSSSQLSSSTKHPSLPSASQTSRMVLRLQRDKTELQKQLKDVYKQKEDLASTLESVRRDLLHEKRRKSLKLSAKLTSDVATSTRIVRYTATAVQTDHTHSPIPTATPPHGGSRVLSYSVATQCSERRAVKEKEKLSEVFSRGVQCLLLQPEQTDTVDISSTSAITSAPMLPVRRDEKSGGHTRSLSEGAPSPKDHVTQGLPLRTPLGRYHSCTSSPRHASHVDLMKISIMKKEVRDLKEKVALFEKQVSRLVTDKQSLIHAFDTERKSHTQSKQSITELKKQINKKNAEIESLNNELRSCRDGQHEMKTKYSVLEALKSKEVTDAAEKIGRLVSEKRRLEERIKNHVERCECQSRTLLSTEDELKRKTEDCKQLEERLLRLERDVRQKRTFIDSLKEKDIKQQSLLDECQGKIATLVSELESLSSANSQNRQRVLHLRQQLNEESNSKRELADQMEKYRKEQKLHLKEMTKCESQMRQHSLASSLLQDEVLQLRTKLQSKEVEVIESHRKRDSLLQVISEHQKFAEFVLKQLHRAAQRQTTKGRAKKLSAKTKELACSALNLTEEEACEFLEETDYVSRQKDLKIIMDRLCVLYESALRHEKGHTITLSEQMMELFGNLFKQLSAPEK